MRGACTTAALERASVELGWRAVSALNSATMSNMYDSSPVSGPRRADCPDAAAVGKTHGANGTVQRGGVE